jgi:guanylate kinase
VIAGPSGVGKGTVVRRLLDRFPRLRLSVSLTTRPPRPEERDGVDYSFVSDEEFAELARNGGLLEWAEVFGHRYGTPRATIERAMLAGHDVVLEIDVQGAHQVREAMPSAVLILLEPPSMEELERRLRSRATEDEEDLERRMSAAAWELAQRSWFDHVVVNDDVERATTQVADILQGLPDTTEGRNDP